MNDKKKPIGMDAKVTVPKRSTGIGIQMDPNGRHICGYYLAFGNGDFPSYSGYGQLPHSYHALLPIAPSSTRHGAKWPLTMAMHLPPNAIKPSLQTKATVKPSGKSSVP
jgi:hypothetical protein